MIDVINFPQHSAGAHQSTNVEYTEEDLRRIRQWLDRADRQVKDLGLPLGPSRRSARKSRLFARRSGEPRTMPPRVQRIGQRLVRLVGGSSSLAAAGLFGAGQQIFG
jgi:hypothetical protein